MSPVRSARRGGFPRGPGQVESARWLARFFDDPVPWFGELQAAFGDLVGVRTGPVRMIVAYEEELVERLLVEDARRVDKGHAVLAARFALGNGLITANGDEHRRNRRIAAPAFAPRNVAPCASSTLQHVHSMLARWPDDGEIQAAPEAHDLSLRVAGSSLFGVEFDTEERQHIHRAMATLDAGFRLVTAPGGRTLVERGLTPSARRVRAARDEVDVVIRAMVGDRSGAPHVPELSDVLSRLLAARDTDDGSRFDDEQVRDEAVTLLLAGHDTTAAALSWCLAALATHDDVQARVQAELDEVLAGADGDLASALPQLVVLRAFVDEVLRLHPIGYSTARAPREPLDVGGGVVLHPGTDVVIPFGWLSRDPRWWHEPLELRIDRFLPGGEASAPDRPRVAYVPFGLGPRVCIGASFAMQTLLLSIGEVARSFDLALPKGADAPDPTIGFIRRPAGPVPVCVTRRSAAPL